MNNEPVAWMMENPQNTSAYLTFEKPTREMKISHQAIPLYTHPANEYKPNQTLECSFNLAGFKPPAKTLTPLTDEEIEIECRKAWNLNDQYRLNLEEVIRFAHAILRKANEK